MEKIIINNPLGFAISGLIRLLFNLFLTKTFITSCSFSCYKTYEIKLMYF